MLKKNFNIIENENIELPNNIEAEQSVIGSILVSNEIFDEINTIISSLNFYDPMHQKIFAAIESLIYKGMLANLQSCCRNHQDCQRCLGDCLVSNGRLIRIDNLNQRATKIAKSCCPHLGSSFFLLCRHRKIYSSHLFNSE